MQEPKILISACLLGEKVKYNGEDNLVEFLAAWAAANPSRFISVCPEVAGGLPIPRPPAERQPDGRVVNVQGADVTMYFLAGAENVLRLAREHNIQIAILKESSPSCGAATIYDGTFSQKKISGQGVTAALLRQHGIRVYSEKTLTEELFYSLTTGFFSSPFLNK